jgi:hypothetical protein
LVLMTELVCTPYGAFGWSSWAFNFRASATHRLALLFGGLSAFLAVLALITRPWWRTRAAALAERRWVWGILLVVALLPLCWTVTRWTEHRLVVVGLREAWGGVRRPLGCLLAVALAGGFLSRNSGRSQALWLVLIATLPVFAYLKGAEQMGMWSQRRLMPAYALLMLAATPWLAHSAKRLADASGARRRRAFAVTGLALFFAGPGLANLVRWPAPYLTRVEHGAWEWAQTVRAALGNRLAFFDYQPFSFALAVDNRTRAFGIGQQRVRDIPEVLAWLRERAATQTVLIVSAYAPPGIEDGVQLVPLKSLAFTAQRIASKGALPAETRETGIPCNILAARPLAPSDRTAVLDKTFDRGPLALRGPWGRADIPMRLPDGKTLPAAWARQGSGMVGPVPPPGQSVAITVWASSAQKEPQRVRIVPPWSGPPVELDLPAQYAERAVRLTRPAGAAYDRATGVYSMSTERPYNPAADGVRGFDSDLVALIHRIRIEPVGNRQ